jgi:IS30 family transposase
VTAWSPEQISHRLKVDFPDDESMRISHEAIYQSLFIQGRGALNRELVACPRTGRALRQPRARAQNRPQGHVTADVVLSERPAEAADRAVPGHWEGDLIIGTGRSAIGTLVERKSRSTLLVHLPRLDGWGENPPVKNGPALGGYGAVAMNAALIASMTKLPEQLRKTLTWDRGKELSAHAQFALETGTKVFFADPHSPWQRPTNENTNGLLRQYFPKRHRPLTVVSRRPRSRRAHAEQPNPQKPRLENPHRSVQRAATLASTTRCCNDRLNRSNFEAGSSCGLWPVTGWSDRWAGSPPAVTMLRWNPSSACCRKTSSPGAPGPPATSCASRSSPGSNGPTTAAGGSPASAI